MTRGQIVLLSKDNVWTTYEFNGDMYLEEGFGIEIIDALKDIKTFEEYEKFVNEFNDEHHKRSDFEIYDNLYECQVKGICKTEEELLDMSKKYFEKWFSDFLYFKNIREEDAYVVTDDGAKITIQSGGVLVLCFGHFTEECEEYSTIAGVSLHQKYIDICEKLGWNVKEDGSRLYLSQYSPAGEDFGFEVGVDNIVEDVGDYYDDFNPDDHAYMWYGRNKGEPSSLRDLLDDAEAIDNMLKELYDALNK